MSRSDKAAKGFVTGLVQYGIQIGVQVFLAPLVLKLAGREALGAYAAISQVVALLTLVDVAHSWSLERFLGQSLGRDDGGLRFRNVFTTARTLLLLSNAIFAALVMLLTLCIGRLFHLQGLVLLQGQHALYVVAGWAIVRTPLAAYQNASIATQDLAYTNMIVALSGVLRAIISVAFVALGGGLFGLMVAPVAGDAITSFLFKWRFNKLNPTLQPAWGVPDRALLKDMIGFGGHAMFLNVGNMLVFQSGNALASYVNGAAVGSGYYTTQLPATTCYNMATRLGENASPAINDLWGRNDQDRLRGALTRLLKYTLALVVPLACGIALFNHDVIVSWVGPLQYGGTLLSVSLAVFCVIAALQRILILYAFAIGWVRLLTTSSVLQGVGNCVLAIYLGRHMGLGGITLALDIVLIPQTVVLMSRVGGFFKVGPLVGVKEFFIAARACILPTAAGALLHIAFHVNAKNKRSLLEAVTECLVFMALYGVCAYFWILSREDRVMVAGRLLRRRTTISPEADPVLQPEGDVVAPLPPQTFEVEMAARPLVSVLFVTYKRPDMLRRCVEAFRAHTDYPNLQLVVTDDGSPEDVQDAIRALPFDTYVLPCRNRGLGANNNQGIAACRGKYIFMIQDDRHCVGPRSYLSDAISAMENNPGIGLLNFSEERHADLPGAMLHNAGSFVPVTLADRQPGQKELFLYTDTPHIITREASESIGPYLESRDMEQCEVDYERRWGQQDRFLTVVDAAHHNTVFVNAGAQDVSFRENRLRYRVERSLQGAGTRVKSASPGLFVFLRACVRLPIRMLEKLGIVR